MSTAAARNGLARLALLSDRDARTRDSRVRATVRAHAEAIRACFATDAFPPFRGATAREAWAFFVALEGAWGGFARRVGRSLGLRLYALGAAPRITLSAWVERRGRAVLVASTDRRQRGPASDFFAPLWPVPSTARAARLLAEPHDVRAAAPSAFCTPRPWRGAARGRLLDHLVARLADGAVTAGERAELEGFALARIGRARARRVEFPRGRPERGWLDLDAMLDRAGAGLSLHARRGRLELSPYAALPDRREGAAGAVRFESAAVARAVYRLLGDCGVTPRALLAHARAQRDELAGRLGRRLGSIDYAESTLRGRPPVGTRAIPLKRPRPSTG